MKYKFAKDWESEIEIKIDRYRGRRRGKIAGTQIEVFGSPQDQDIQVDSGSDKSLKAKRDLKMIKTILPELTKQLAVFVRTENPTITDAKVADITNRLISNKIIHQTYSDSFMVKDSKYKSVCVMGNAPQHWDTGLGVQIHIHCTTEQQAQQVQEQKEKAKHAHREWRLKTLRNSLKSYQEAIDNAMKEIEQLECEQRVCDLGMQAFLDV